MNNPIKKIIYSISFIILSIGMLGLVFWSEQGFSINSLVSLSVTSRTTNAYFAAIITAMALIITLTSNLYSPRLAKVLVSHPYSIIGVGYFISTNFFIVISHLLSSNHPWFETVAFISFTLTIISMVGMIPFLYLVSQFVKPSYFIKILTKYIKANIDNLHREDLSLNLKRREAQNLFELVDVINNMASTAIQRRDRSVLGIVISELFTVLNTLIKEKNNPKLNQKWRSKLHFFTHGMSEEAKFYLRKDRNWPEAYILSKILENALVLTKTDNEMVPLICRELTFSNDMAINFEDIKSAKLNMMILNSILKESLESRNEQKFSSVLYYYRMNIELFIGHDKLCNKAIEDFLYYGRETLKRDEKDAAKSFLFDLGRVINYLAFESEELSLKLYKENVKSIWNEFLNAGSDYEKMAYTSIIKAFWNLYSQNYNRLTTKIQKEFLKDNMQHARILNEMIKNEDPLAKEFSDTLINPEYLSGMALTLARDFLTDFKGMIEKEDKAA